MHNKMSHMYSKWNVISMNKTIKSIKIVLHD